MKLYQIYLITNTVNEKVYVGQTVKTKGYLKRFEEHCYLAFDEKHRQTALSNAIRKYGAENFKVELLEDDIEESLVDDREKYYINECNSFIKNNSGYNMTLGGQGVHGYIPDDTVRKKISDSLKGREIRPESTTKSNETKHKNGYFDYRRDFTDWKDKISKSRMGRFCGEDNPFYGKHHSSETKAHISEINSKPILMIDRNTDEILCEFTSLLKATEYLIENKITSNKDASSRISKICRGVDKTAYGYKWKYKCND